MFFSPSTSGQQLHLNEHFNSFEFGAYNKFGILIFDFWILLDGTNGNQGSQIFILYSETAED